VRRSGALLVLGAALLWSTGGTAIKAIDEAPLKIAFYRSAFAAVALFAVFRPRALPRRPGLAIAVASYAACLTTFVIATKWTTAANAIFLQYSGVIWVLLASPVVLRERFRLRDVVAVVVALGGMALFFVGRLERGRLAGDFVAVVSGILFAALVISLRRERGGGAEAAVTWGNVAAAAALLPFVAGDLGLSPRSAVLLVFLGLFQIAGAYVLFVRGLRHVSALEASLLGMLEPIANPIWVFLLLGERPGRFAILGGAIVLGAIAWRTVLAGRDVVVVPPPD
jgi:drug/metabolite transporter (DMT)-like permease